ncbi:helix-turn-helix domain-containing protein [Gracilibacillus sp. HCP3S3_G5_1]|uniref:helix-turn-helix domain-containing protein n=1 Tax=Bacillaceae TaxID=186817 RepID=UPI00082BF858|nr:helix-turn-helix domain-containing protein [Amphibacillus sediminis]HLS35567.1 helix-turn-helix domain-containing protein [Bacillota bacterium]
MTQQVEKQLPYLLTREQASKFLGIDPKSFDKYIRYHDQLERFMIGRHERYTVASLIKFIEEHSI